MHFPINIDNHHWMYAFISVEHEAIFFMDSIASLINTSVKKRIVQFANTIITRPNIAFKPVYCASPFQGVGDGVSCGVITIFNILKVSKAEHDGELDCLLTDQKWGKKLFTTSEKVDIRANLVDIIRGTKTVDVLFKFLN